MRANQKRFRGVIMNSWGHNEAYIELMTTDLKWSKFMQLELMNALGSGELLETGAWWGQLWVQRHQVVVCLAHIGRFFADDDEKEVFCTLWWWWWWWLMFSDLAHGWGWHPGLEDDWRKSCLSSLLHHQSHQPWLLVGQIWITWRRKEAVSFSDE